MVGLSSTAVEAMEMLVSELGVLLKLLDQENLTSTTQEQKTSVRNLLRQIQPSTEYIYENSSVYSNGTSFVESLFDTFDCDLAELGDVTEENRTEPDPRSTRTLPLNQGPVGPLPPQGPVDSPPPLPTTPPPEEYYEEAVPLSPGKVPEYITATQGSSSPPNSIEDGYEDTESYSPTCISPRRKNSYNDSDALSSSYESYGEDEDERSTGASQRLTHQWPSDQSSMPPARDCQICAFLLRKKRFGQWAKQLTVIRESRLQCYKSSKDAVPSVDLALAQCSVLYAPKDARKKRHELRFSLPSGEPLVLAVQSREQAHRWLRVIKEVCDHTKGGEESNSPIVPRKSELDKRLSGEKTASDSEGVCVSTGESFCRDTRENGKVKRGALAAGRKITRIISFSKKKPPRPGEPACTFTCTDPRQGYLSVLVNQVWKELWCCVRGAALHFCPLRGDPRASLPPLGLQGCEVLPGLGPKHPFALRILKASMQVAALEAGSSVELGRWLGVLLAETGTTDDPESLHYDYVDVETIANIRDAARHSFLTYDEVYEGMQPEEEGGDRQKVKPGAQVLRRPTSCSSDSGKTDPDLALKRSDSNDHQYGRYGKTRAEEDAKRYQREKEELERERDGIRNALVTLRQEKREVKEEAKTATAQRRPLLSERLARLEDSCRGKEAERVDLELQLTQVKENLSKSLAGGVLGAPQEGKPHVKAACSRSQNVYWESGPVHCASESRKRTAPPGYASSNRTVMQKAKEQ
ncbi:actin filament-associated protein 1-like 1 [Aplochiton taeniatus]